MSVKGDKSRVTDRTRYEKNYTKIFGNWVETKTTANKLVSILEESKKIDLNYKFGTNKTISILDLNPMF